MKLDSELKPRGTGTAQPPSKLTGTPQDNVSLNSSCGSHARDISTGLCSLRGRTIVEKSKELLESEEHFPDCYPMPIFLYYKGKNNLLVAGVHEDQQSRR